MIDILSINAAIQGLRGASDLLKAGDSIRNTNNINTAIAEALSKLVVAQREILAVYEKQATLQEEKATLTQRARELEQKIVTLENWQQEAERYALTEIASGVFVHCLKPGLENGEPPHKICTHCYNGYKKEVLQSDNNDGVMSQTTYTCPGCGGRITVRHSRPPGVSMVPLRREREKWGDY